MSAVAQIETITETVGSYTLEVIPPGTGGCGSAHWRWAIRKGGKLLQRSDRSLASEFKARTDGLGVIEKLLTNHDSW
jgi:hypothetical protein